MTSADAGSDNGTRIRRTLEGVLGVPATEGNRVDVLRNGDEIFPAMFEAIDAAEHTIDFLTFVYWTGRGGRRAGPPPARRGPPTACGSACCSTHGVPTRWTRRS